MTTPRIRGKKNINKSFRSITGWTYFGIPSNLIKKMRAVRMRRSPGNNRASLEFVSARFIALRRGFISPHSNIHNIVEGNFGRLKISSGTKALRNLQGFINDSLIPIAVYIFTSHESLDEISLSKNIYMMLVY